MAFPGGLPPPPRPERGRAWTGPGGPPRPPSAPLRALPAPKAPARPAAQPGRSTHSAAAETPRACDLGGVRQGKEGAGAGGGGNPLPRGLRDLCAGPRQGACE